VDQELQARERLALNCTGVNNDVATMPLRINWVFTSFDNQFPQESYNVTDPRISEIRMADNIIVISFFVIDPVMATDAGVYGCQVSNRVGTLPIEQNATVNVFCKWFSLEWLPYSGKFSWGPISQMASFKCFHAMFNLAFFCGSNLLLNHKNWTPRKFPTIQYICYSL
jgi:hypothetical protein